MKSDEKFTYNKSVKNADALKTWMCFPSTYAIGMSSLGYLSLFRLLDQVDYVYPERIFTNTEKTEISAEDVELLCFSVSFELNFIGIFDILKKYNMPFRACDRKDEYPIVIGGGPVLSSNPEPYAPIFDAITIGEGENLLLEISEILKDSRGLSRQEKLLRLSQLEGVYVPEFYEFKYKEGAEISSISKKISQAPDKIKRIYIKNIDNPLCMPIISSKSMFPNSYIIETSRGCPRRCKFCLASYLTLPARYPVCDEILKEIDRGLKYCNKIALLGALITEHPEFDRICDYIIKKRQEKEFEISVSSLRIDRITPSIIKMLVDCGQKNATVAIEAGSERLRKFINKNLSKEDICRGIQIAAENGLKGFKTYGIIGLPTEEQQDIDDLVNLMKDLKKQNKGFNLSLSISSFVPKAHTPFERQARQSNKELEQKSNCIKKQLLRSGIDFKPASIKWEYIQGVLSMGDRRLYPILEQVYEYGSTLGSWNRAYKSVGKDLNIPPYDWYILREKDQDEILPWSLIDNR